MHAFPVHTNKRFVVVVLGLNQGVEHELTIATQTNKQTNTHSYDSDRKQVRNKPRSIIKQRLRGQLVE
jgi:hypothetical protein